MVLHVYEIEEVGERSQRWLSSLNLGIYHTGIEVGGWEYSFSDAGVFRTRPKRIVGARFKESLILEPFRGSSNELNGILREMRETFPPGSYNLVRNNCNNFSDALAKRLGGPGIPAHLNRAATLGAAFLPAKAFQAKGDDEAVETATPQTSFWTSLFSGSSAAPVNDAPTPKKKKELTAKQRELLAKVRQK